MSASPLPGMDMVDNGDGTATTYYSDGSTVRWDIGSGAFRGSTPPDPSMAQAVAMSAGAIPRYQPGPSLFNNVFATQQNAPGAWGLPWGQPGSLASGPMAAGAGTTGTPYGMGWIQRPGSPGYAVTIDPTNLQHMAEMQQWGYIPGSGTFNQASLDKPLFDTRGQWLGWGSGGPGDPSNGLQPQTPEQWMQGDKLFELTRPWENLSGDYGVVANNFLRSDTPSGVGSLAAPDWLKQRLVESIQAGVVRPTARGQQYLAQMGVNPAALGGAAGAGAGAGAGGVGGVGGPGAAGAGGAGAGSMQEYLATAAAAAAADRQAYWARQQALTRQDDQRIADQEANDAWTRTFNEKKFEYSQSQDALSRDLQVAGMMGTYQGQQTLAGQQQQWSQGYQQRAQDAARQQMEAQIRQNDTQIQQAQARMDEARREYDQTRIDTEAQNLRQLQLERDRLAEQQRQFNAQQAVSEAGVTGVFNGAPTLAAQQLQNQTALSLLSQQAQLRGPRDWLRYQQMNTATPQGLRDVLGAFAGRYQLPGAQGQTGTGGPATVASGAQDLLSAGGAGGAPPAGGAAGAQGEGLYPGNPLQADVRNWARMAPSAREMVLGQYEAAGAYAPDIEQMIQRAAPRYSYAGGAGTYQF